MNHTSMNHLVYKVVNNHSKGLRSAIGRFGKSCVHYRVGKWAVPHIGKLFAFDTFRHAENFRDGWGEPAWLAEAKGVEEGQIMLDHNWCTDAELHFFWNLKESNRTTHVIRGSLFASRLRLLEPVTFETHDEVLNRLTKETGCGLFSP